MRRLQALIVAAAVLLGTSPASAMTPLLLYKITTPSSGAVSTITDTSTGTALNLTCTAVVGTSIGAGVGATFGPTSGAVSARLNGTKVATALAGITAVTWEFVADTTADAGFMELVGFQDAGGTNDIFSCVTGSAGNAQVGVTGAGGTAVWFDVTPGLHHFMAVQENGQATNTNRIKLYVDGSPASVNSTPFAPTYPTLNQAIDAGFTNYANNVITIGCLAAATIQPFTGSNYAALLYASALTSGDASSHSTALLANNDNDPNAGGGGPVYNSLFLASAGWGWAPPPCVVAGPGQPLPIDVLPMLDHAWWPRAAQAAGCAL